MTPRPVYVIWKDHAEADTGPWSALNDLDKHKLATCRTLGYLIEERDDCVLVAGTLIDDLEISSRPDIIAKALIVSMTELDLDNVAPTAPPIPTRKRRGG